MAISRRLAPTLLWPRFMGGVNSYCLTFLQVILPPEIPRLKTALSLPNFSPNYYLTLPFNGFSRPGLTVDTIMALIIYTRYLNPQAPSHQLNCSYPETPNALPLGPGQRTAS